MIDSESSLIIFGVTRLASYFFGNKLIDSSFDISDKSCQFIDLKDNYEIIFQKYSTNLKRNLTKAKKNNLEIVLSLNTENVVKLFKEKNCQ